MKWYIVDIRKSPHISTNNIAWLLCHQELEKLGHMRKATVF